MEIFIAPLLTVFVLAAYSFYEIFFNVRLVTTPVEINVEVNKTRLSISHFVKHFLNSIADSQLNWF